MKNKVLEEIRLYALERLGQDYGYGCKSSDNEAKISSYDDEDARIEITIKINTED